MKRIVYLPIEIKSRDFQNKLLLTYFLTLKGFQVFLGRKKEIEILAKNFHPGIYFGVNTQKSYIQFYKQIKKKKNIIFLFDEEGLVTLPGKTYASTKANKKIIDISDFFFCWGQKQIKKILSQKKINKEKLVLSGSLRIELLKKRYSSVFKSKIIELKKKYKDFKLFISCYGYSNHYIKQKSGINNIIKYLSLSDKKDIENYKNYLNFNRTRFHNYINELKKLKTDNSSNVVIRPHPSENHNFYKNISRDKNFFINNEYSVIEWINASKYVIHDYCTTSFEANILKKKTFYYSLSPTKFKYDKDVYKISNLNNPKLNFKKNKNKNKILKNHIYNYKNISSVKIICDIFERYRESDREILFDKKLLKSKLLLKYYSIRKDYYTEFKTPYIKKKECEKFLKKIERIERKKNNFHIKEFAKNIMFIKSTK